MESGRPAFVRGIKLQEKGEKSKNDRERGKGEMKRGETRVCLRATQDNRFSLVIEMEGGGMRC